MSPCDFCGSDVGSAPSFDIVVRLPSGAASAPMRRAHIPCVLSALEGGICPEPWVSCVSVIDSMPEMKALRGPKLRVV